MSLIESSQMESTAVRFTPAEFIRMGEAGVFDDRERVRIELIEGEIREMMSPNAPHGVYVQRVMTWAVENTPKNLGTVFCQHSLQLTPVESVVEPDLYVVVLGDYLRRLPNELEAMLVAEVADSSRNRDLGEKASLYSRSGIADYWVVDVARECIHVHRNPNTEGQGGYESIRVFGKGDSVSPLAFPEVSLKVETVFQE